MEFDEDAPFYCPVCDRLKENFEAAKKHVEDNHPDYDPLWYETYPEND
jgi:hypothetical protein